MAERISLPPFYEQECVLFEEAINWIAFGHYGEPAIGPAPISTFHAINLEDTLSMYGNRWEGRRDLAVELLVEHGTRGVVRIFGRRAVAVNEDELGEAEEDYTVIPPTFFSECSWAPKESYLFGRNEGWESPIILASDLVGQFPNREATESLDRFAPARPSQIPEPLARPGLVRQWTRRGRPPKWDWKAFALRMADRVKEGLPQKQAAFEAEMAEWCAATWGDEPALSQIRERVGFCYTMYTALRAFDKLAEKS